MFEEYQIVFVLSSPEEGNENMRFIVNVESSPPANSQGNPLPVICPYVPFTIHAFSTALCGASASVSFVLGEFTFVVSSKRCCKTCKMLPKWGKIDSECKKYNDY